MSDKIKLERSTRVDFPLLRFLNPANGGDHIPSSKVFRPDGSWGSLEVWMNPATHKEGGGWVSFTMEEGYITSAGRSTSKSISMTLNKDRARELYEALDELFGKRTNPSEG